MAELREYRVTVNGHPTIMNLTEEDAARLGGVPVEREPRAKQRPEPPNKARTASNKTDVPAEDAR
ncbi:hypothetical protein [Amycolatopsis lurida]|uniref:hypothetical protein n=1 Tax=Amycolatopsis lurida TaxID=31959 RepID=UPI0036516919